MVVLIYIISLLTVNEDKRFIIESSKIEFYSKALLEDIQAENIESIGAIDMGTGEFVIKIPVSSFEFPNKLMQKHFNDSYLETDKYPECTFRGTINNQNASGEITLHGVTKKINIPISLEEVDGKININTNFKIILKDHKIKIPKLLFQNIAEEIEIKVTSTFTRYVE
tara:strand:+ start:654 stop:1157 length:504 start_codon:yes stop_codon:yes gene_type:complete